ncbi:hypothetical protein ACLOAV_001026 [Pseudogymnoascus australis]
MTDTQPPHLTPGPTPSGAIEDELELPASAEDRKAAAALSALDAHDDAGGKEEGGEKKKEEVRKVVKVEAGDVKVVIEHCELSKPKATDLLKANDGDLVKALRAFVSV